MASIPIPPEVLEDIRDILHGDNPDKLTHAFEYAMGENFRVKEVIEATPTKFVCMTERIGKKYDGLLVRAEMAFDLSAGTITDITLKPVGRV